MSATRQLDARDTRSVAAFAIGALVAALVLLAAYHWLPLRSPARAHWPVPLATPPGITLQQRNSVKHLPRGPGPEPVVYADEHGMTLYARGRGPEDACRGECLKTWRPGMAPPGAKADGDWSLIARPDGARQWAYRGAPLYRYAKDAAIGDALGDGLEDGAWRALLFDIEARMSPPGELSVHEIADAGGTGLTDADGLTIYVYRGGGTYSEPRCDPGGNCPHHWRPLAAPAIASRAGDWSVITRGDGIAQWAYRNSPLYTCDVDRKLGDANGTGIDPRFEVALVVRQFMPAGVTIRESAELGKILATSAGAALYQRDRLNPDESHDLRGDRGPPALGRAYGTATCEADCAKERLPLLAPADALPSGYWAIVTRPEGTRQWAYKGFALYTYAHDAPGELRGNESYELAQVGDDAAAALAATGARGPRAPTAAVDPPLPFGASVAGVGLSSLFWHVVVP